MSLLPVRVLGDPILRRIASPVDVIGDDLKRLADDMYETMYAAKGIGLAAPQIGIGQRMFITDVDGARHVMINPELIRADGDIEPYEEGCLSIPEVLAEVKRPTHVIMSGRDLNGEPFTIDATGLLARCMLHELDHLNGRLFIDHLSLLKRRRALSEWAAVEKEFPGHIRILTAGDPGDPDRGHSSEEL